jgi:hypothetical protein
MFKRELACTAVGAHNVHEAKIAGRVQEGGTGSICFGETVGYVRKTGKDEDGLGRWCWILLSRNNGHQTRIITAYNPCKNKAANSGTAYQQQQVVLHHKEERPHLSMDNILAQSDKADKTWWESGDRIILFMDHNKHVTNGPLGRVLGDNNGLDLREAIIQHTGARPGQLSVVDPNQ